MEGSFHVLVLIGLCGIHLTYGVLGTRPNIVFILADDLGYNDIGYTNDKVYTPNLDKMASEGVRLENYYVQPICAPTRSVLMSGMYQIHTGLFHSNINIEQPNSLPEEIPTLADKMKEAGYSTHMVGKWHLGFYKEKVCPWKRGFDTFFGYLGGQEDYFTHKRCGRHPYLDLRDQNGPVRNETGHYSTHLFTDKAVGVVNSHNASKPLFLYLAYQAVHGPLQVPKSYTANYTHINNKNRRKYAGMISAMDEGVGNLTRALKDAGLWNNTIIVFSTDNGGLVPKDGRGGTVRDKFVGSNYPLRGGKSTLWEGGVHGLGFVGGGWMQSRGQINDQLVHVSDWFPTLVGLARGNLNNTMLDGYNMWDTIISDKPSPRTVLLHNIDVLHDRAGTPLYNDTFDTTVRAAIRVGDFKLITGDPGHGNWYPLPDEGPAQVAVDQYPGKNVWLFNIRDDPNEHHDLADDMPDKVRQLLQRLDGFRQTAVPVRFPPQDHKANPALRDDVWGPWL